MKDIEQNQNTPYIPPEQSPPEVTAKAVIIGVLLAAIFTMSSLYIGLKFARTVAASIPAALISLMIFKAFKKTSILENVVVQTIASAAESVAAMAAFCITAIVLSGYWSEFRYLDTVMILGLGGILGVFISIPLRNIMIVEEKMPYPEGIAVAEVLISGESKSNATRLLLKGSFISALITLTQSGFKIGSDFVIYGVKSFGSVLGVSVALSPLSLGAGYIIGIGSSGIMLIGAIIANFVILPYLGALHGSGMEQAEAIPFLVTLQKQYLRYVAVGVMLAGSLWSLLAILPTISKAIKLGISGSTHMVSSKVRTERDIPSFLFITGVLLILVCIGVLFYNMLAGTDITYYYKAAIAAFAAFLVIVLGFIMSSVASQLVGILGTTSLPASGLCLATIILFASAVSPILLAVSDNHITNMTMIGLTLVFTSIIGAIAVLGGDNMQDLKTGYLIGATPWKQQAVLVIGIIASVITTPFVLQTMFEAYGIGDMLPRAGMDPAKALSAPQSILIASVTKGLFIGQLPWTLVNSGIVIAAIVIVIDLLLTKYSKGLKLPIMTFAAGFYLPIGISIAFFCGGILRAIVSRNGNTAAVQENGVMIASGFIAGEAIMGALLSIPFAIYKDANILAITVGLSDFGQDTVGMIIFAVCAVLFLTTIKTKSGIESKI